MWQKPLFCVTKRDERTITNMEVKVTHKEIDFTAVKVDITSSDIDTASEITNFIARVILCRGNRNFGGGGGGGV